jgi:hypothetical protein
LAEVNADYISRAIASNSRIQWVIIDKHAAQGRMCLSASMRFQETQSLSTRPAAMAYSKFSRSAASWAAVSPPAQTSKAQSAKKLAFCSTSFRESTNFDESPALARAQCFWQTARAAVSSGPSQRERNSHPSAPAITENHEVPQLHPGWYGWFIHRLFIVSRILDLFDRRFYTSPKIQKNHQKSIIKTIRVHLIPTVTNAPTTNDHLPRPVDAKYVAASWLPPKSLQLSAANLDICCETL